jgi:hypothetical protein
MTYRILIVANQTLGGEDLAAMVRERVQAGATELWVVVPATHPRDLSAASVAARGAARRAGPRYARDLAQERLEAARDRLGALGVVVGGEVGDADPFQAVSDALAAREVDEVIISTLPTGRSRWLSADLPSRVRRAFSVPVTTVIGRVVGRS